MVAVPPASDTPQTAPEDEPTVAINVLLLLHVPPPGSVNVVAEPAQAIGVPEIGLGNAFTVTTAVKKHPRGVVYVMMVVVENNPAPPVRRPVADPMDAMDGLLEVHAPPVVASVSNRVSPAHTRG